MLFHDPATGQALLTGGADFSDMEALKDFFIGNARRLGTAGKILFPIPNRRLSKRLYRLTAPTLVVWGAADRLIVAGLRRALEGADPGRARGRWSTDAGHMLPYEQPEALVRALDDFLG